MQVFKMNVTHNGRIFLAGETLESKMKYLTEADLPVLAPFLTEVQPMHPEPVNQPKPRKPKKGKK